MMPMFYVTNPMTNGTNNRMYKHKSPNDTRSNVKLSKVNQNITKTKQKVKINSMIIR